MRGAIYDPYVRRIMHEGLSTGGRFDAESDGWLDCPTPSDARTAPQTQNVGTSSALGYALRLLGLGDSQTVQSLLNLDVPSALGLTTRAGTEKEWDDAEVCPYAWARPIHALNCDASLPVWPHGLDAPGDEHVHASADWPEVPYDVVDFLDMSLLEEAADAGVAVGGRPPRHPELFELDTPEYAGRLARGWVVERLLAMAGVRLAGVLTDIFADVAGDVDGFVYVEA